jgi:ferrous iron transport protein B
VERNLNLVLQVLEITDRVVVCLNLMDEARRHGLEVDDRTLARELGVPVVPAAARQGEGLDRLLQAIGEVATGKVVCQPHRIRTESPELTHALAALEERLGRLFPGLPNARWVALRLLDGDERIIQAVRSGELAELGQAPPRSDDPAGTLPLKLEMAS